MGTTSASGAGGGAIRSVIAGGALAGKTLHDAIGAWGDDLIAKSSLTPEGNFPLLVKFLDASENLSVQVHPSPAYAASHAGAFLKTECWHILKAAPGAVIYKGIKPSVKREEFARLARAQDPRLVETLIALPAVPGKCHNLPSGTVHALGAGVLVAEVQTPSDTTYRVYDWGRTGREMHVEQTLACATFPGEPGHDALLRGQTVAALLPNQTETRLVTTEFFTIDELRPALGSIITPGAGGPGPGAECIALIILDGSGSLMCQAASFPPLTLRRGDTVLLPRALAPQSTLIAGTNLRALRASIA
jgi:mannose-6-phosphate isomerase